MDYAAKQAIDTLRREVARLERRVAELERKKVVELEDVQVTKDEGGDLPPEDLRAR